MCCARKHLPLGDLTSSPTKGLPPGGGQDSFCFPRGCSEAGGWKSRRLKPDGLAPGPPVHAPSRAGRWFCGIHPGPRPLTILEKQLLVTEGPHFSLRSKAKLVRKGESQWGELSTLKRSRDFIFKSLRFLLNKLQQAAGLSGRDVGKGRRAGLMGSAAACWMMDCVSPQPAPAPRSPRC